MRILGVTEEGLARVAKKRSKTEERGKEGEELGKRGPSSSLRAADRDRGSYCDCQKSWEVIVGSDLLSLHSCPFTLQVAELYVGRPDALWQSSGCYVCECRVPLLEEVRIGEACHVYSWGNPDEPRISDGDFCVVPVTTFAVFNPIFAVFTRFYFVAKKMSANQEATSSGPCDDAHAEKSVEKLSVKSSGGDHAIYFSKEQFNAGLRFPLPCLCSRSFCTSPRFLRRIFILIWSGADGVQHPKPAFQFGPHTAGVGDQPAGLNQGGCQGPCAGEGLWAGLGTHPDRPLLPTNRQDKRGKLVEWVEKASFDRLNRLYEIAAASGVVICYSPLRTFVWSPEPQPYVLNILPRRLPKEVVSGEHFVLPDCHSMRRCKGRRRHAKLASIIGRKKGKRGFCGRLRVANDPRLLPCWCSSKEEEERGNNKGAGKSSHLYFKRSRHLAGLNHSGPSMSAAGRWLFLAEEATSINQPGSPHPDAGVAASCAAVLPPMAIPMEEMGAENQSLPSCGPSPLALVPVKGPAIEGGRVRADLKSGLLGRFKIGSWRPLKSAARPSRMIIRGSEAEMVAENPPPRGGPGWGFTGATQAETAGAPDPEEESLSNASSGGNPLMMQLHLC
ncbi:hypothetical protein CK203_098959 [Vitis vinifera]|uniref:Uncharacterized protein n=1 Tax=Vitis vinifera TaxID=29760 RepID=A0A438CVA4_VITVI|nr:hypothetical protein CK203_098959 [Vitis vinifera]